MATQQTQQTQQTQPNELTERTRNLMIGECLNFLTKGISSKILDTIEGIKLACDFIELYGRSIILDIGREIYGEILTGPSERELDEFTKKFIDDAKKFCVDAFELGANIVTGGNYERFVVMFSLASIGITPLSAATLDEENLPEVISTLIPSPNLKKNLETVITANLSVKKPAKKSIENANIKKGNDITIALNKASVEGLSKQTIDELKAGNANIPKQTESQSILQFGKTIKTYSETASLLGVLTNNADLYTAGVIGEQISKACVLVNNFDKITDVTGAFRSFNGFLSIACTIQSLFSNKPNVTGMILDSIASIGKMLAQKDRADHQRYLNIMTMLGEQRRDILTGFFVQNATLEIITEKLNVISSQIHELRSEVIASRKEITDKIDQMVSNAVYTGISTEKTEFKKKILEFDTRDASKFDTDVTDIYSNMLATSEAMSGYSDVTTNNSRLVTRFNSLPPEFNVNSVLKFLHQSGIYMLDHNVVCRTLKEYMDEDPEKKIFVANYITHYTLSRRVVDNIINSIFSKSQTCKYILLPIVNKGFWSGIVVDSSMSETQRIYYVTSCRDEFIGEFANCVILFNDFMNSEFIGYEYNSYLFLELCFKSILEKNNIDTILSKQSEHKIKSKLYKKEQEVKQYSVKNIQNPLMMTIWLSVLMERIEKQRDRTTNIFPQGFISSEQFVCLENIALKLKDYAFFLNSCKDSKFLTDLMTMYMESRTLLYRETQEADKLYFLEIVKTEWIPKLKELDSNNQKQIVFFDNYNLSLGNYAGKCGNDWFHGRVWHYAGRNAGADNRSGPGQGEGCGPASSNHSNHMSGQYNNAKNTASGKVKEWMLKPVETFVPTFDKHYVPSAPVSYIRPHIIVPMDKQNPILIYTDELFNEWKENVPNAFIAQQYGLGKIVAKYFVNNETELYICFKFQFTKYINKEVTIAIQIIKLNVYIYDTAEAIFWNWYGGNVPTDYSTWEWQYNDTGCNAYGNAWRNYAKVPNYRQVTGIMNEGKPQIKSTSVYPTPEIEQYIIQNRVDKCKDFTRTITSSSSRGLRNALDQFTGRFNLICDVLRLLNVDPAKVFDCDKYYSSKHIDADKTNSSYADKYIKSTECDELKSKIISCTKFSKPINWIHDFGVEKKFSQILGEISVCITSRLTPTEKVEEHKKMTNDLMKIFEISHENPTLFTSFDVPKCAREARTKFEHDVDVGNVKGPFRNYFRDEVLMLTDVPERIKNNLIGYIG